MKRFFCTACRRMVRVRHLPDDVDTQRKPPTGTCRIHRTRRDKFTAGMEIITGKSFRVTVDEGAQDRAMGGDVPWDPTYTKMRGYDEQ